MGRRANKRRLQEVASLLQAQPGRRAGEYARILGMHREDFSRALVQLNDRGVLLSEDDRGHLWPFTEGES
jgi:DNA-binding IclR family transcriptional regulator